MFGSFVRSVKTRSSRRQTFRCRGVEPLEQRNLLSVTPSAVDANWFTEVPQSKVSYAADFVGPRVAGALAEGTTASLNEQWIVQLKPEAAAPLVSPTDAQPLFNSLPFTTRVVSGLGSRGLVLVETVGADPLPALAQLRGLTTVSYVEANGRIEGQAGERRIPNDSLFTSLTGLDNAGTVSGIADADIDAPEAWHLTTGSRNIVVAVLDSGIAYNHPDLVNNIWTNVREIAGNGIDDDGNGVADDVHGYDFRNNDGDPFDDHRHGTHVAGIIGAEGNNSSGVVGVNWQTTLLPLKFLDSNNQGETADAVRAIRYATLLRTQYEATKNLASPLGANVRIVNNSWGTTEYSQALFDAVQSAGQADILFVAAAGNGDALGRGVDLDQPNQGFYPASLNLPNVISVAATDSLDRLAPFSNYGLNSVDIAAPGVGVLSTEPGFDSQGAARYASRNGTSMATPYVSGAAAMVFAYRNQLGDQDVTALEVRDALLSGADDGLSTLNNQIADGRRLNVLGALTAPTFAPRAALATANNITTAGATSTTFTVRYTGNVNLDLTSIDNADVMVRRQGFAAYTGLVSVVSQSVISPSIVQVTYRLPAPGGAWDATDNGTFELVVQRGQVRDIGGLGVSGSIVGTFNVAIANPDVFIVTSTLDTVDAIPGDGLAQDAQGFKTLRAAIMEANAKAGVQTIVLPDGRYVLNRPGPNEDASLTGDLDITGQTIIIGSSTDFSVIDGNGLDRMIDVRPGGDLQISGLTLTQGNADFGGALRNRGTAALSDLVVTNNTASRDGGGIYNWYLKNMTISSSEISFNSANGTADQGGGGIFNGGSLLIDQSLVRGNRAAAGLLSVAGGGGVFNDQSGVATVRNTTFSGNQATHGDGGGIYSKGKLTSINNTIADNVANTQGGGLNTASGLDHPEPYFELPGDRSVVYDREQGIVFDDAGNIITLNRDDELDDPFFLRKISPDLQTITPLASSRTSTGIAVARGLGRDAAGKLYVLTRDAPVTGTGTLVYVLNADGSLDRKITLPFTTLNPEFAVAPNGEIFIRQFPEVAGDIPVQVFNGSGTQVAQFFTSDPDGVVLGGGMQLDRNNRLVISEASGPADAPRINVFSSRGALQFSFGGTQGAFAGFQVQPSVQTAPDGRIFAFEGSDTVHEFSSSGTFIRTFGFESFGFRAIGPNGLLAAVSGGVDVLDLNNVSAGVKHLGVNEGEDHLRIAVDSQLRVVVSNSARNAVDVRDLDNRVLATLNVPGGFSRPGKPVIDTSGNIFVADTGNNRIAVFNASFSLVRTFSTMSGGGSPRELTLLSNGNLVVLAEGGAQLHQFTATGTYLGVFTAPTFNGTGTPRALTTGPNGVVYVMGYENAGNAILYGFDNSGEVVEQFWPFFFSTPVSPSVHYGIAVDERGTFYLSSSYGIGYQATGGVLDTYYSEQNRNPQAAGTPAFAGGFTLVPDYRFGGIIAYVDPSRIPGDTTLTNTLIARNEVVAPVYPFLPEPNQGDDFNSFHMDEVISGGGNLIGIRPRDPYIPDGELQGNFSTLLGDQWGTFAGPLDPLLSELTANGGKFASYEALGDSPAVDRGIDVSLLVDQRGFPRPVDGDSDGTAKFDVGASERVRASVRGLKYLDANGNGRRELDEVGLVGYRIFVDINLDGLWSVDEPSTLTVADDPNTASINEAGTFVITGLPLGNYRIGQVAEDGFVDTAPFTLLTTSTPTIRTVALVGGTAPANPAITGPLDQSPPVIGHGLVTFVAPQTGLIAVDSNGVTTTLVQNNQVIGAGPGTRAENLLVPRVNARGFLLQSSMDLPHHFVFDVDENGSTRIVFDATVYVPDGPSSYASSAAGDLINFRNENFIYTSGGDLVRTRGLPSFPDLDAEGSVIAFANTFTGGSYLGVLNGGYYSFGPSLYGSVLLPDGYVSDSITDFATGLDVTAVAFNYFFPTSETGQGIYAYANDGSSATTIANSTTTIPGRARPFTFFGPQDDLHELNNHGIAVEGSNVVFVGGARGSGGQVEEYGIYASVSGVLTRIVDRTTMIAGRMPVNFAISRDALRGNELAFYAEFSDGTEGIFVAELAAAPFANMNLSAARTFGGIEFGSQAIPASLSGTVFNDADGDGVRDAIEAGRAGVNVYLDTNGNRVREANERFVTTDSLGNYALDNLPALTTYNLAIEVPPGLLQSFPTAGSLGRYQVTLGAGEMRAALNFGLIVDSSGGGVSGDSVVQGRLYDDNNRNGIFDAGDTALPSVTVYLDQNDNQTFDPAIERSTTTNASGQYTFDLLGASNYRVRVVTPNLRVQSGPYDSVLTEQTAATNGDRITDLVAGDFNQDGYPDLASTNQNGNNVSILLNDRNGSFAPAIELVSRIGFSLPIAVAVGNFDGLLGPDLAVIYSNEAKISVYLNTGNVNLPFAALPSFSMALPSQFLLPQAISVANVDQSGFDDLLIACSANDTQSVVLFRNQGLSTGQFNAPQSINVGGPQTAIWSGLLNGDGLVDMVVGLANGNVALMHGLGNGTFSLAATVDVTPLASDLISSIAAGDVDRDGVVDLAVGVLANNSTSQNVAMIFRNASGGVRETRNVPAGVSPLAAILTDLDNDNDLDLAVVGVGANGNRVSLIRNQGNGTFAAPNSLGSANLNGIGATIVAADFDRDQVADLASAAANPDQRVITVYRNRLEVRGAQRANVNGTEVVTGLDFAFTSLEPGAPQVNSATISEDSLSPAQLFVTRNVADGPEVTHFKITAITGGSLFLADGITAIASGSFITVTQGLAGLKFLPSLNFSGTANVTFRGSLSSSDSGLGSASATAAINVTAVNDPPVNNLPAPIVLSEGGNIIISGLSVTDIDAGNNLIRVVLLVDHGILQLSTSVGGGVTAGQVTGNGSNSLTITASQAAINATLMNATGLRYTPSVEYFGSDRLAITTNDLGNTGASAMLDNDVLSITVNGVNDGPLLVVPANVLAQINGTRPIDGIVVSDIDALGGNLSLVLTVARGTLSLRTDVGGGLSAGQIMGNGGSSLVVNAPLAAINATLAAVLGTTYHAPATEGSDQLTVLVIDQGNTGSGGALTDTKVIPISVVSGTVAPIAQFNLATQRVGEGAITVNAVIQLSSVSLEDIIIPFAITGSATSGVDYTLGTMSPVTIPAGQTSAAISIQLVGDSLREPTETIVLALNAPVGATLGSVTTQTISILDSSIYTLAGGSLTIRGTAGDNPMSIVFGSPTVFQVTVDGFGQSFTTTEANTIHVIGFGGEDTLVVVLPATVDMATLRPQQLSVQGTNYTLTTESLKGHYVFGQANDSGLIVDSATDDRVYQLPAYSLALDSSVTFFNQFIGLGPITSTASGGFDTLFVYGSDGNDTYAASTTSSTMTGSGLSLIGTGFEFVAAYGSGGNDSATFAGSANDEIFTSFGGLGYNVVQSGAFSQYLVNFAQVTASDGGGNDSAILFDGVGDDTFTASPTSAKMAGAGFETTVQGYDFVFARHALGGVDTALLDGSGQAASYYGEAGRGVLYRPGVYSIDVRDFRQIRTTLASRNAGDFADLNDSTGDDRLNVSGNSAELIYASGDSQIVTGFDQVIARGTGGGRNTRSVIPPLDLALTLIGDWG